MTRNKWLIGGKMLKSFREHLDYLESKGKLLRVKKGVSPRFEIAAGIRKVSDTDGPALLFENIKGYPGWRVAGGVYATQKLLALALGVEDDEETLFDSYREHEKKFIKPKMVSTGPCKEVVIKGDDIDLYKLPISTYNERDFGPYLTSGIEITKDITTGAQNNSIIRRQVMSKDKLSLGTVSLADTGIMVVDAEKKGVGLGVATAIGVPPALTIASQLQLPFGVDEAEAAGSFQGEPIEMIKCETIDVEVPANSEIVIEGVIIPGERVDDGPFGEFPGNYVSMNNWFSLGPKDTRACWVTKTTAITMRKDAIFHAMLTGMPTTENHILTKYARMSIIHERLLNVVPRCEDIRGIYLSPGGGTSFHVVVSIYKRTETTPRDIIYLLLLLGDATIGRVTVVDDDINCRDLNDVEWAVATRCQPDRDVIILPVAAFPPGYANPYAHMHRWGIDATRPAGSLKSLYDRAIPPGVDKVDYV